MNYFASNIKLLRKHHNLSQSLFASKVNVSRANVAKYEGAIHEPPIDVLIRMSRFFDISLDALITFDISRIGLNNLEKMGKESKMVFPIQVDPKGDDVIEVVPHNAKAGYTGMYGDVGFIESLDHLNLPILQNKGKCRAFPISGDSMPPYGDGSFVIGEYVDDKSQIKSGERYVLLSRDEGIVFKRIQNNKDDPNLLNLHSDNPKYESYEMHWSEVLEVWKFVAAISMNESNSDDAISEMMKRIEGLQNDLRKFSSKFSN